MLYLPENCQPHPGQYLPCQNISQEPVILPTNVFRVIGPKGKLCVAPLPANWYPGDGLILLPPQGHGFSLPVSARRVGLLALDDSPARLLTLVEGVLAQDAAVTLFFDALPEGDILSWVPPSVEVVPLTAFHESLDWLDFLAVDINLKNLDELTSLIGDARLNFAGQVLVRTAMPCRGLGACGVCAVKTHQGWRLTCVDGPVFPLKELLHVA